MLRLKKPQDLGAGLLFIAFGLIGLYFGRNFAVGTAARMGPGYFPMMLSWLLIAIGAFVAARAFATEGPNIAGIRWRSLLSVLAAVGIFAVLIQRWGVAAAIVAVIGLAALATRETRWREVVPLALFMAAFCVAVFIYGLHQPLPLWGED
jgi:hypothetical protein